MWVHLTALPSYFQDLFWQGGEQLNVGTFNCFAILFAMKLIKIYKISMKLRSYQHDVAFTWKQEYVFRI